MSYETLLAKLEALRTEANQAGFELIGTILTKQETALTDLVMSDDSVYDALCNAVGYACEELDIDSDGFMPCVCVVKSFDCHIRLAYT